MCWHRLAQGDRAARAYERALELAPRDRRALRTLIQVEESAGRSERVVELYRRELSLLDANPEDRERRFDVWLRIASLHRADPERRAEAIEAYCEAASIETLPAPDELALARLYAAGGDAVRHAETLGRWCDREDSAARIDDHLELARALLAADDARAALARAERAAEVAPAHAEAWTLVATLTRDAGDAERAADAWERAAEHSPASRGARHLVDAAACLDPSDGERAMALLERAVELDPGLLSGHVALTRVASVRSAHALAERSADAALELARAEGLEDDVRLDVAVLGGRAAQILGHREASRRLFACALEIDPDQVEALEGVAAAHFADGDHRAARVVLERRIDLPGENPQLARQLAMIARGLEAEDHLDAAWARYEEALGLEPALEEAHEGLVRVHERASRPEEALAALERWCDEGPEPELLATQAIRAAEHALALEDVDRARDNLDRATRAAPRSAEAWSMRCDLAAEHESEDATRRLCAEALDSVAPGPIAAKIALRAARLAEAAGRYDEALARYAESARWDPRCSEAALSESRLVRRAGDWLEADSVLERFLDAHPDPTSPTLAHVHLERGRLLSGPLEDVDRAIEAYERALALQPELAVARTSLGKLLAHAPDRWREALAVHRTILESSPTTASSLRALAQIAEQRGARELAGAGLAILHALGLASPQEAEAAPARLGFAIHPGPPMDSPDSERLRRLAHQLAEELAPVVATLAPDGPAPGEAALAGHDAPIVEAGRVLLGLEDELTARGLSQLSSEDRRALFLSIAALFLDPGGNGGDPRFHDPLDQALGRWTRRKVRRVVEETSIEAIEAIDFEAWGDELRTLAAAQAVDRGAASLRDVLRALVLLNGDAELRPHFDQADLGALAVASEPARRLLIRVTTLLCERLEAGR
ncbi:MAG: tetratricopeptide repeat protein [Myxococcota bacterium]